jgi:hypothetical protein
MSGFHPTRGERIDIGGRCLRAVLAGPAAGPLVVLECGAFGCAADWAEVQKQLAAANIPSLAYDRAGLGYSDPGPRPRDGQAIAHDLGLLLDRMRPDGPLILVGHSMAGLMVRLHARGLGDRVLGLVLVDATTPESWDVPTVRRVVGGFGRIIGLVGRTAPLGYMRPLAWMIGDNIGLDGEAGLEKRRIYGSASHTRWAAEEVQQWGASALQGQAIGRPDPDLPVAVVTAGARPGLKTLQSAPALASRRGHVNHVGGANHASLLGRDHAHHIVEAIRRMVPAAD